MPTFEIMTFMRPNLHHSFFFVSLLPNSFCPMVFVMSPNLSVRVQIETVAVSAVREHAPPQARV